MIKSKRKVKDDKREVFLVILIKLYYNYMMDKKVEALAIVRKLLQIIYI